MTTFRTIYLLLVLSFFLNVNAPAQSGPVVSFEFQAYPTGLVPGISLDVPMADSWEVYGRAGFNWIRHRDLGKHEDERGDGYGFSLGVKKYFSADRNGWRLAFKNDIWWNEIEWTDPNRTGVTDITVVQPTIEGGYRFGTDGLIFTPTVAFGFEVNVQTSGEPTGEGAILLLGFQMGYRL